MKKQIAIFASGNGSNCENLIRHFVDNETADVALVVCNRPDARVLDRAKALGVDTAVLSKQEINTPETMLALLQRYAVDYIVLAGFLLMIPDFLLNKYDGRIVNIHPSLLPKFGGRGMYGHYVHEAVKAAGETETGITIHRVSPECDGGEILAQFRVPLSTDDTSEDIARKVHELEMNHFPSVVESLIIRQA